MSEYSTFSVTLLSFDKYVHLVQGELAFAFGDLLRKLWVPGTRPVAPRMFKSKLVHFAPQFSGYNQHDSQVSEVIFCL
jgi:hypothetical protein